MAAAWTVLTPDGFRRLPWKNGGGVTIDVAAEFAGGAADGDWADLVWRFGSTSIPVPGPFSDMSGFDRILTPVRGAGLSLAVDGGATLDARVPLMPVRFSGDLVITSRLDGGPVDVVNLMARRDHAAGEVVVLRGGEVYTCAATDVAILFAPNEAAEVEIDGVTRVLSRGHALRADAVGATRLRTLSGVLLLATIKRLRG
jgi:environmental stress-induced protein Ves